MRVSTDKPGWTQLRLAQVPPRDSGSSLSRVQGKTVPSRSFLRGVGGRTSACTPSAPLTSAPTCEPVRVHRTDGDSEERGPTALPAPHDAGRVLTARCLGQPRRLLAFWVRFSSGSSGQSSLRCPGLYVPASRTRVTRSTWKRCL